MNWFRECIKGQIWKTIVNDFFQNILDGVKSSGTVLEETSCTILSPNILDMVKSSGTDLKAFINNFVQIVPDDVKCSGTDLKNHEAHFDR